MKATNPVNKFTRKSRAHSLRHVGAPLAMVGVGLALAVGQPAQALNLQTFTLISNSSETQTVNMSHDGGAHYGDFSAGRYQGSLNGGPAFNIFCIDASHIINYGDSYLAETGYNVTDAGAALTGSYYPGGLSSALTNGDFATTTATLATQRSDEVAWLIDQYLYSTAAAFAGNASGSTDLVTNLAAIQMSIWDIAQDGGDGLNSGSFRTNASAQTTYGSIVSYYETQASGHSGYVSADAFWIQAPETSLGNHAQDFASDSQVSHSSVPEPGNMAMLLGLGLSGVGLLMRKRRCK